MPAPRPHPPARAALLAAAGAWHQRLEDDLQLAQRLTSCAQLACLLRQLWRLHRAVELAWRRPPSDQDAWPAGWQLPERGKSQWLAADLRALRAAGARRQRLRPAPALACWRSVAGMAGCLWVVEGSTLGGRQLAVLVRQRLGVGPEDGGAFFAGYQQRSGTMWRRWLAQLESALPDAPARQEAGAAAAATFAHFHRHLVPAMRATTSTRPRPPAKGSP